MKQIYKLIENDTYLISLEVIMQQKCRCTDNAGNQHDDRMMIDGIEKQLQYQYAVFMMFHYPSDTADIMKLQWQSNYKMQSYEKVVRT